MAYTSLEPQMEYFILDGVGYIAYIRYKHWLWAWKERKIVLADPICALDNYSEIISPFIKKYLQCDLCAKLKRVLASVLDKLGYQVNLFGVENKISLTDFSLEGKQRAKLRQWQNKCVREGVTVKESCIDDCNNLEEINSLVR